MGGWGETDLRPSLAQQPWVFLDSTIPAKNQQLAFDPWAPAADASFAHVPHEERSPPTEISDPGDAYVFDPWNQIAVSEKPIASNVENRISWLPSYKKDLRRQTHDFAVLDSIRFDSGKIRVKWILGILGPCSKREKNSIERILSELLDEHQGGQQLFQMLCDLALNCDGPEDFKSAISLKLWWNERPEYWIARGRGPWSFIYGPAHRQAMTLPMCLEIASAAGAPSFWDYLPADDWLVQWQSKRSVHNSTWTFAQWIYSNITGNPWSQDTIGVRETEEHEADRMTVERLLFEHYGKGSNTGPSVFATGRNIDPVLHERLRAWNEKQEKKEENARRYGISGRQHVGESRQQAQ